MRTRTARVFPALLFLLAFLAGPASAALSAQTVSWETVSWETASWHSASWETASWDSASWDSASWETASWDTASWDTASWDWAADGDRQSTPWWAEAISLPRAHETARPQAERLVCLVDSGVDASHPALAGRVAASRDFVLPGGDAHDESGHGTHLAGLVAAVSPAKLAVAKVLDASGTGPTEAVVDALSWCGAQGAHVVLLALNEDAPTRALREAVAQAQRRGALVVASAGNEGACPRCASPFAAMPGVLAAGALAPDGEAAAFSAGGPHVDVHAPGVAILSSVPGGWRAASGTSQAAALAAGVAALAWAHEPRLDADAVARAIVRGAGQERALDAAGALDAAAAARGGVRSVPGDAE